MGLLGLLGSVPLYLCSRYSRPCMGTEVLQSADRGRTKSGARLESAERGQGDKRAASERGPANTVVIRALTTKNPIRLAIVRLAAWTSLHTRFRTRTARIPLGLAPRAASIRILHVRVR